MRPTNYQIALVDQQHRGKLLDWTEDAVLCWIIILTEKLSWMVFAAAAELIGVRRTLRAWLVLQK